MLIISHRGNLNGSDHLTENSPEQITKVLSMNIDCEIDVWMINKKLYLGHDEPQYEIIADFLKQDGLWVHAKNLEALSVCKDIANTFYHNVDDYVLTSKNYIWAYPGKPVNSNTIIVLKNSESAPVGVLGVCTDYPLNY